MPEFLVTLTREQTATIVVEADDNRAALRAAEALTEDELLDRADDWAYIPESAYAVQVDPYPLEYGRPATSSGEKGGASA